MRAGDALIDLLSYDETELTKEEGQQSVLRMHGGGQGMNVSSVSEIDFSADVSTLDHLCLRIEAFDEANIGRFLNDHNVQVVSSGIRKGADGSGPAVYINDPKRNVIELKGSPEQ